MCAIRRVGRAKLEWGEGTRKRSKDMEKREKGGERTGGGSKEREKRGKGGGRTGGGASTTENREKGRDKEGEQGLPRIEKRDGIRRGSKDYRE